MLRLKTFGRNDAALAPNLYIGAFLDGVFLPDAPDFEHWLDGVRLRLGQAEERVSRQSRDIRRAIGDAGGLAECDAELTRMATPA